MGGKLHCREGNSPDHQLKLLNDRSVIKETAYRWRNLRRAEERVRSIQKSLRKLVKSEEGANSTKSVEKTPSTDRTLE
ncbi:hypothetical protein NC653_010688 [Populus alba x Populus x berolinensis]|uniref:Uncharacterized protein n=1 Tax=Populus alba x Populus x berolinensis TaxID=444605 RepID=A0AAD6R0S1_9ROSI|nr:hypothetical protein NC653_010688 [Populus alba x Populus x berolinensis]